MYIHVYVHVHVSIHITYVFYSCMHNVHATQLSRSIYVYVYVHVYVHVDAYYTYNSCMCFIHICITYTQRSSDGVFSLGFECVEKYAAISDAQPQTRYAC